MQNRAMRAAKFAAKRNHTTVSEAKKKREARAKLRVT
jgi:hypothetical protein